MNELENIESEKNSGTFLQNFRKCIAEILVFIGLVLTFPLLLVLSGEALTFAIICYIAICITNIQIIKRHWNE